MCFRVDFLAKIRVACLPEVDNPVYIQVREIALGPQQSLGICIAGLQAAHVRRHGVREEIWA